MTVLMSILGLLAVVALVALYVVLQLRRKAYAARFTNVALLSSLVPAAPAGGGTSPSGSSRSPSLRWSCRWPCRAPRSGCRASGRRW